MINPVTDVQPIHGESGCFLVQSASRPEVQHRVEVEKLTCGCERFQAHPAHKGQICPHIERLAAWIGWDVIIRVNKGK